MNYKVIITAGGSSQRYGHTNKLLEKIDSKEVIKHAVEAFSCFEEIDEIVLSAHASVIDLLKCYFADNSKVSIVQGGSTRQESVFNGLKALSNCDYVLIHDGARPLISNDVIKKVLSEVVVKKALTVATKTTDTIKQVDSDLKIIKTIDRSCLYNTQTPQAFEYGLIMEVHQKLSGQNFTDDAGMLESLGADVFIVEGDYTNIKITTKNDLDIATVYFNNSSK